MTATAPPPVRSRFLVHTLPGDGSVSTSRFATAEDRLEHLRQRALEYFPASPLPSAPPGTDEAAYLAQLLGFFLMLNDGSVTLEDVRFSGE